MPLILPSCHEGCRVEVEVEPEKDVALPALSLSEAEGVAPTLEQDRLTFDKAMLAFEAVESEIDLFELLSVDEMHGDAGLDADQLSYQRALEAVYETDPAIAKQAEVTKAKRDTLVKMIGNDVKGGSQEGYDAAKAEYERARDLLRKLKVESSALYRKE
ncbi:hypothetical protein V2O64_14725 [Verrucomicrobiaceae bacterium 227]